MSDPIPSPTPSRRRRRSRRRKLAESVALALGVPALLFVVLVLSVEVIEYRPVSAKPPETAGIVPISRVEIPPVRVAPLRLHTKARAQIDLDEGFDLE